MLLSAVSVLVVAQSSLEIPEGLMNNPVYSVGLRHGDEDMLLNCHMYVALLFRRVHVRTLSVWELDVLSSLGKSMIPTLRVLWIDVISLPVPSNGKTRVCFTIVLEVGSVGSFVNVVLYKTKQKI